MKGVEYPPLVRSIQKIVWLFLIGIVVISIILSIAWLITTIIDQAKVNTIEDEFCVSLGYDGSDYAGSYDWVSCSKWVEDIRVTPSGRKIDFSYRDYGDCYWESRKCY